MANYRITDTTLTRIGDATRRINGSTSTLSPSQIATIIENTAVVNTSDSNSTASDILSGQTAYVNGSKITGTLVAQSCYTGTSDPSSSLGNDGDIYLKTGV